MNTVATLSTIIRHELKTLSREKTFFLLLGIFLAMTFFSVYIGWSTRTTTSAIYDVTVTVLQAAGTTVIPSNPVLAISPLAVFDNMIIYLLLVGALLAMVMGHRSFIRERTSGVVPLLLVRPLTRGTYVAGKLSGIAIALIGVVSGTFLVSVLSAFFIPALHLSGAEFLRLAGFYGVSFLYLAFFAALGFLCAVFFSSESIALFVPIMVWIGLIFILPELSTGQNPVSLLNPITLSQAVPNAGAFFAVMGKVLGPFSLGQQYTGSALVLLKASHGTLSHVVTLIAGLVASVALAVGASILAIRSYSIASDPLL